MGLVSVTNPKVLDLIIRFILGKIPGLDPAVSAPKRFVTMTRKPMIEKKVACKSISGNIGITRAKFRIEGVFISRKVIADMWGLEPRIHLPLQQVLVLP